MSEGVTLSKDAANALIMYLRGELIYSNSNLKMSRTERERLNVLDAQQHIKDLLSLLQPLPQPTTYK
jgi:hypothetical protein